MKMKKELNWNVTVYKNSRLTRIKLVKEHSRSQISPFLLPAGPSHEKTKGSGDIGFQIFHWLAYEQ